MNLTTSTGRVAGLALTSALLAVATSATQTELETRALNAFALQGGEVTDVTFSGSPGSAAVISFDYAGEEITLDLNPHSALSADAKILADLGGGELVEVERGLQRTYRGTVADQSGSRVAGGWMEDGFYGRVILSDGSDFWIQPMVKFVEGASASQHVVYTDQDVIDQGQSCGGALLVNGGFSVPQVGPVAPPTAELGANVAIAELGVDCDFEFYQDHGSTTTGAMNRVNLVIDTMNLQYESQVGITHAISTIIVRTSSNDPYSSSVACTILDEFMDEWNNNQGGIPRDTAHLFTGKNVNGGTIGIAYLSVICNTSFGYGVVESDFNNNFNSATDLSAHELGHNWSANHCSCGGNTMNAFITSANSFHATFTIPGIESYRDSRICLDTGPVVPTANFTGTPLSGFAPLIVTFTDTSSGAPTSWLWDFGDGATSTIQNVGHVYATAGSYTVSLTATNANGSDTLTRTNYVVVDGIVSGTCTTRNGTGVNPNIYACVNTPSIGNTWTSTLDAGSVGASGLSILFAFGGSLPPFPTAFGELLIDPTTASLLTDISFILGGTATHAVAIPADGSLISLPVFTQGFLNGFGILTNAIDIVIGS